MLRIPSSRCGAQHSEKEANAREKNWQTRAITTVCGMARKFWKFAISVTFGSSKFVDKYIVEIKFNPKQQRGWQSRKLPNFLSTSPSLSHPHPPVRHHRNLSLKGDEKSFRSVPPLIQHIYTASGIRRQKNKESVSLFRFLRIARRHYSKLAVSQWISKEKNSFAFSSSFLRVVLCCVFYNFSCIIFCLKVDNSPLLLRSALSLSDATFFPFPATKWNETRIWS